MKETMTTTLERENSPPLQTTAILQLDEDGCGKSRLAPTHWTPFTVVVVYALAMGWVESAVVFYMRTMIDRLVPYQPNPLPFAAGFGFAEVVREAATLIASPVAEVILRARKLSGRHTVAIQRKTKDSR